MVGAWHSSIASSFEQAVALVNTGEKELLFLKVWDKGMGPDDYRGTMEQIGTDDDGGKLLQFTTDSDTFRNLQSAMDKMEE